MSQTKSPPKPSEPVKTDTLTIGVREGDDVDLRSAEVLSGPFATNAMALNRFARGTTGDVSLDKLVEAMTANADRVKKGDMRDVEAILVSQATVLNGLFADLLRRSSINFGGSYFDAGERYLKLAFKAQNQARMTLETLSTVKNPPVIYAKQANIANGPQQVNNGTKLTTRAEVNESRSNKQLEACNEKAMDSGAAESTVAGNSAMATLGISDRAKNARGKGSRR
ncbi:hypothetical protein [Aestuariivirga sp.]|uniref:hypothetical protein n=1 Tax=Aestuariivirga sp. TaxID=2650926 RepID=UPI003BAA8BCD